jgi:hypothetical protein
MNEYCCGYEFNPMYQVPGSEYVESDEVAADDGSEYELAFERKSIEGSSLLKPLGAALAGALLGGWITDSFPLPTDDQSTKIQKSQKMTAAFLASGFVGLIIGMIGS